MIGRTIDRYQVVEELGQGGMGVVYKARDTLLDRFVALKVLPPDKTSDPERRRRFLHEAKAASALNHPGIVSVYDVRTVEGQDVIVMELVEGETLEQLLARKRLALGEALGLAARIADAVARAHAAGIVHRDLKPSNVMVTADGVKVLDFGLAKLVETPFAAEDAPTLEHGQSSLTEERVILGTLAYMSPEQAAGRAVDARSDVFAFGVVLYEMLTRHHPFRRKTALETLSAIREGEPEAPTRLVPGLPPEAERAVLRCLRKDPARRWQNLSDLGTVLQDLKEDSESGRTVAVEARPRAGTRRGVLLATGAVLLLAVGVAAAFFLLRHPSAEEPAPLELSRLTYDGGANLTPSLSPDGKLVAYASDRAGDGQLDIWVRHIARPQPARLTDDPTDDWQPSFAPDGSRIAFRSERDGGGIYLVNVLGGPARRLVSGGTYPRFSPDGTRVLYMDDLDFPPMGMQRMFVVSVEGGEPTPVLPGFGAAGLPGGIGPLWSPDGERILFAGGSVEKPGKQDWWVAPVEGGEPVSTGASENLPRIDTVQFPCAWLPRGQLLFLAGSTLEGLNLYTALLSDAGRAEGPPHRLTAGPGLSLTPSVAGDGRIALERLTSAVRLWEATLDPRTGRAVGEARVLTADATPKFGFSLTRDGSLLAFSEYSGPRHGVRSQIRLRHLDSGQETVPVSFPAMSVNLHPRLSPDGRWLAWSRIVDKEFATFVAPTGEPTGREVCRKCASVSFLSGASEILVDRGRRLARIRLADGVETPVLDFGQEWLLAADVSADEKWVALSAGRPDGHVALHVIRLDTPPDSLEKGTLITDGTSWTASPRWSPDGRLLYYLSDRDGFNCVWATLLDPRTKRPSGEPFPVLHAHRSNMNMALPAKIAFSIAISARRLVLNASDLSGEIYTGLLDSAPAR
jgi:Tol biopolymer transport system component/predicted Ser/Thr protein kinase